MRRQSKTFSRVTLIALTALNLHMLAHIQKMVFEFLSRPKKFLAIKASSTLFTLSFNMVSQFKNIKFLLFFNFLRIFGSFLFQKIKVAAMSFENRICLLFYSQSNWQWGKFYLFILTSWTFPRSLFDILNRVTLARLRNLLT